MGNDDFRAVIQGRATFEVVDIKSDPDDGYHVTGYYGDGTTTYAVPAGRLFIAGYTAEVEDEMTLRAEKTDWVWAHSTGDELHITREKPEDDGT